MLTAFFNGNIHATTISSLQSIDVANEKEMVSFVLKNTSLFGRIIKQNSFFTVSALSSEQSDIATFFSLPRELIPEKSSDLLFRRNEYERFIVKNSLGYLYLTLESSTTFSNSTIYFAKPTSVATSENTRQLLYSERNFGIFKAL